MSAAVADRQPKAPGGFCISGAASCNAVEEEQEPAPAEPSTGGVKWHPGHYMQIRRSDSETVQSTRFAYYDEIATNSDVVGVVVPYRWRQLEGPSRGDYSAGIALVRSEIAKLKSLAEPKRLFVRINDIAYNSSAAATYPQYVLDSGAIITVGDRAVHWRRWREEYMDWYRDMLVNLCMEFDDEPYFEGLYLLRETAMGWLGTTPPSDFSYEALDQQLRRLGTAVKNACPNTNVVMPINFLGGNSMVDSHFTHLEETRLGWGGPDVVPTALGDGIDSYDAVTGFSSGIDYRGRLPGLISVETSELGGVIGDFTPTEIFDFANETLNVSHLFWDRNTYAGTAEQQWGGILKVIASRELEHTGCPAVYSSCDTR